MVFFGLKQSQDLERLATHFHKNSDEQTPPLPCREVLTPSHMSSTKTVNFLTFRDNCSAYAVKFR